MAEGQFVQNSDGSWSQQTHTTGTNVQEAQVFNALAITDTATKVSNLIDVSKVLKKCLLVVSTLDQAVSVAVQVNINGTYTAGGVAAVNVAAGGKMIYTSADLKMLDQPFKQLKIAVTCATAPTTGSISIIIGEN